MKIYYFDIVDDFLSNLFVMILSYQTCQPLRFRRVLYYFQPFFSPLRLLRILTNSIRFSAIFYSSNGSTKHVKTYKNHWRRQILRQIWEKFVLILIKNGYILAVWRIEIQIWRILRSNLAQINFSSLAILIMIVAPSNVNKPAAWLASSVLYWVIIRYNTI